MTEPLFRAKTQFAYVFKLLIDLLNQNVNQVCFEIDHNGIQLNVINTHRTVLMKIKMLQENFNLYKFTYKQKLFIGVNLTNINKLLKSIKKKDSLELILNGENANEFGLKVIPKEKNRITTSYILIQDMQCLHIDIPTGYTERPINIKSQDYQKLIKDMVGISKTVNIKAKDFYIAFLSKTKGIIERCVEFNNSEYNDHYTSDPIENVPYKYDENFDFERLQRIIKIAGLGSNIKIYTHPNLPLLLKSNIKELGTISIFIKPKDVCDQ